MKIKYKISLSFIAFTLLTLMPLSWYYAGRQRTDRIAETALQGKVASEILARLGVQTLLASGADATTARLDAAEAIRILQPYFRQGLVRAQLLVVSGGELRGLVLAEESTDPYFRLQAVKRVDEAEVTRLLQHQGFSELREGSGEFYEFVSVVQIRPGKPVCAGRVIYSKAAVLAPVEKFRTFTILLIIGFAIASAAVSLLAASLLTRPIYRLIEGVKYSETGDFTRRIEVKGRDEFARLARTFNDYSFLLRMQIKELVRANEELKRLDQLKDEFLANMSHELRSPLHGMMGLAESLISGAAGDMNQKAVHDLGLIVSSGKRLAGLVNDILDFARLKNSDISLKLKSVDLAAVVTKVIEITGPVWRRKKLAITTDMADGICVRADEDRLEQILLNLIGNAIKFTREGSIAIRARILDSGDAEVEIIDTGIGIGDDIRDRIFDSFVQEDTSESREYSGAGLGLAITRRLVELHGGNIAFESRKGEGSRFFFRLPGCAQGTVMAPMHQEYSLSLEKTPEHMQQTQLGSGGWAGRILIVDDENVNLQILMNVLQLKGYLVVAAENGAEALEILERESGFDLVLLDVMMPRMSGYQVCRRVRERYSLLELPIIMLTAKGSMDDVVAGIESGANDYLAKPVNTSELIARVNNLVMMRRSVAESQKLGIIRRDMELAHDIQQSIIAHQLPEMEGAGITVRYLPADELGGDLYEIRKISDDEIGVMIADVSGHGVSAALLCSMLKVAYAMNSTRPDHPGAILADLNRVMYDYLNSSFVTVCAAYLNIREPRLIRANAGHWPVLRCTAAGEVTYVLKNGFPLGWATEPVYEDGELAVEHGDRIVFYTDMIVEAKNADGKLFGIERLVDYTIRTRERDREDYADGLIAELRSWSGMNEQELFKDDLTLIVVDIFPKKD